MKTVVVDYGCGNPASIVNMLKKIGHSAVISHRPEDILTAGKLIFPGVGSSTTVPRDCANSALLTRLSSGC
jgi:glutamine amidotransferase